MISSCEQRKCSGKFVKAALEASGMDVADFAAACKIKNAAQMRDYTVGVVCPTVDRILLMHELTGIRPDDFGIPVLRSMECAAEMRTLCKQGHSLSEFAKATRCDKRSISRIINGANIALASALHFEESWRKYNVPERLKDPEFASSVIRKSSLSRSEKEYRWIERVWGGMSESAKEIRNGFWIWFSDSIYRLELEHIADDLYEFRGIFNATGEVTTRREVHIV